MAAKNREQGIPGQEITLNILFYTFYPGGILVDDDRYVNTGKLPVVTVYDPDGVKLEDSSLPNSNQPVRTATGKYEYNYTIPMDAAISTQYTIAWSVLIGGVPFEPDELFSVISEPVAVFTEDSRIGFSFGNPDLTSDTLAPGWGQLITCDDLRWDEAFGNALRSSGENQTITDDQLRHYAAQAIGRLEEDLNIHILSRIISHNNFINDTGDGAEISRNDISEEDLEWIEKATAIDSTLWVRESPYRYDPKRWRRDYTLLLREKPLRNLTKLVLADDSGQAALNLFPFRREFKGLDSYTKITPGVHGYISNPVGFGVFLGMGLYYKEEFGFFIDYKTGYENARDVPKDLRTMIKKYAALLLLDIFGDGKTSAVASTSASLNNISESLATTLSATSALFGARLINYAKDFDRWYKNNAAKYRRNVSFMLG